VSARDPSRRHIACRQCRGRQAVPRPADNRGKSPVILRTPGELPPAGLARGVSLRRDRAAEDLSGTIPSFADKPPRLGPPVVGRDKLRRAGSAPAQAVAVPWLVASAGPRQQSERLS